MSRTRKQDAWVASVRISIPITATDPQSIARAQESVARLATLIPGSTVEITHAGFGRMAAPVAEPQQTLPYREPAPLTPPLGGMTAAMAEIKSQIDDLEPPESLRLVPRQSGAA